MENKTKITNNRIEKLVKKILADQLGIDPDEIANEDYFTEDLGMGATELSDFFELLSKEGFDIKNLNLPELETVADLIENLNLEESV